MTASAPETGDPAPEFELQDAGGQTRRLGDYRGQWVVLYFYPKDDTPGCTQEACGFRDQLPTFQDRDACVLGVSPDDPASHAKFSEKFELPFPLLADVDKQTCQAYGVWKEKKNFGRTSMGVERSTFLIDPDGVIARAWRKVKVDGHEEAVREALDAARASRGG